MIDAMINRAEFRFNEPIKIDVPLQLSSTTIYLRMRGIHSEQTSLYPISGFPRSLIAEDMINGTSLVTKILLCLLNSEPETRLDKRAELIKERRYGGLVVANDPKVALPNLGDRVPQPPPEESPKFAGGDEEHSNLARADSAKTTDTNTTTTASTAETSNSRASSHTILSQKSGGSSSSKTRASRPHVSIADIRAEAQSITQDDLGSPITIKDGDRLAKNLSTFSFGSNKLDVSEEELDLDSDDSDGPPSGLEDGDDEDDEDDEGEEDEDEDKDEDEEVDGEDTE